MFGDEIERIIEFDPLTGEMLAEHRAHHDLPGQALHHRRGQTAAGAHRHRDGTGGAADASFARQGKLLEAQRLEQRTTLRPGDDPRGRLLLRHRELLAPP